MKKIILFSVFCSLLFVSCSDNDDYENDINKQLSIARTEDICSLLESVAIAPDKATYLESVAYSSLDSFDSSDIQDEETEGLNRATVISTLFEIIASNPELYSTLSPITEKYIGAYKTEYFSDNTKKIAIMNSMDSYLDAAATNSNAVDQLEFAALLFLGCNF